MEQSWKEGTEDALNKQLLTLTEQKNKSEVCK